MEAGQLPSPPFLGYHSLAPMSDFVHLHTHSDFSLLDGAASVEELVARAKALGMKALALTDHGNMFGSLRFYKECLKEGVKPIIGCEAYVAPDSRLSRAGGRRGRATTTWACWPGTSPATGTC